MNIKHSDAVDQLNGLLNEKDKKEHRCFSSVGT